MTTEDQGGAGSEEPDKRETPPATGAKHQDGSGDKPDRSEWIPRARFDELVDQVRDLKGKLENPPEVKAPPREFTRAELAASVEKGDLTQDQANNLWERQIIKRADDSARETANQVVTDRETARSIDADMLRYKELIPAVMRDGTEEREKVAKEYRDLVARGSPKDRSTELAALRVVFGSIEKIEKAQSRSKPDVQSDEQTGAGGDTGGGEVEKVKGLTARERAYYTDQIAKGRYKDWDAVKEELTYAKTALRRKMGAKV